MKPFSTHCVAALCGVVLTLAAGAGPAPAQEPTPEFRIDVSGWVGGAQAARDTQQFSHCGINREYDDGLTLFFLLSPQYEVNIGLLNPAWSLTADQRTVAQVRVDRTFDGEFPARAIGENVLIVTTGVDEGLIERLMRGNELTVVTGMGDQRFSLIGTFAGLTALRSCVDTARRLIAAAPQGGAPAQDAPPMSADALAGILRDAGLQGAAIGAPTEGSEDPLDPGFVWVIGPLRGGVHQDRRGETVEMDSFANRYIARFETACGGAFERVVQPAEVVRDVYAMKTATVQCGDPENGTFVALFFALDDGHYTAFFHESSIADKELAIDATTRIRQLVSQQAGG